MFCVLLCVLSSYICCVLFYVLCCVLCVVCCACTNNGTHFSLGVDAVGILTSVPEATDGVLTVCPGESISITCTHDNVAGQHTRWILPGVTCTVVHDGSLPPNCSPIKVKKIAMATS